MKSFVQLQRGSSNFIVIKKCQSFIGSGSLYEKACKDIPAVAYVTGV